MVKQTDLDNLRELDAVWSKIQRFATSGYPEVTTAGAEAEFSELLGRAQVLYGKTQHFIGGIWLMSLGARRDCFQLILGLPSTAHWRQPLVPDAWSAASSGIRQAMGAVEAQLANGDDEQPHASLDSLHADISVRSRDLFESGKFDEAIFNAMKVVEDKLRKLIGAGDDLVGLALVSKALSPKNPQLAFSNVEAEQEAFHSLFRGAIGTFKNPLSHRFLDTSDPLKTLEVLALASLLARLLDEVTPQDGIGA